MSVELAKVEALKVVEVALEQLVSGPAFDALVKEACDQVAKVIPGTVDDLIIAGVAATMVPALKAAVLAQVEKISAEV